MAFMIADAVPWHDGEKKMRSLLVREPHGRNPTNPFLSPGAAFLLHHCPLLALGTLDRLGRPWATVWGGEPAFAGLVAESTIRVRQVVDARFDPVVETVLEKKDRAAGGDDSLLMAGLPIDLEKRKRVKLAGRIIAASMESEEKNDPLPESVVQAQILVKISESMGNCPKYLNKKRIIPALPEPKLISDSPQLPPEAVELLNRADTLFLSTSQGTISMDCNVRGGAPGFVRVLSNGGSGAVLVYPEYSGNRLYQSLGNMQTTPKAGLVFPDFDTGNVLFASGNTEILTGKDAAKLLPRSNLAIKVTLTAARFVEKGLAFRGVHGDRSPYNPAVRFLPSEKAIPGAKILGNPPVVATLIKKELMTRSIGRFRFKISDAQAYSIWIPGQYATLSFKEELDMGYSHMRDDDPTSINDDYIRTFTVSSYPGREVGDDEFEIIVRKKGNATSYLFRANERGGIEIGLKGFDGHFQIKQKENKEHITPFIAGGIGITPVIGQLPGIDISRFRLFWSFAVQDIALVADVFEEFPDLPNSTTLFITGTKKVEEAFSEADRKKLELVLGSGAKVHRRRLQPTDLDIPSADEWYLCASPSLNAIVLESLKGKKVISEDFDY